MTINFKHGNVGGTYFKQSKNYCLQHQRQHISPGEKAESVCISMVMEAEQSSLKGGKLRALVILFQPRLEDEKGPKGKWGTEESVSYLAFYSIQTPLILDEPTQPTNQI